ncbi:MAG: sigma-70 family RNA polymerase sigma factor [Thermoleophilia bacterium]
MPEHPEPAPAPAQVPPGRPTDAELLRRVALGDETAFAGLWERYGRAVFGACRAVLGDTAAAEDATQEAFTRVWRMAHRFDPGRGSAAGWLLTVARNSARNAARGRRPLEGLPDDLAGPGIDEQAVSDRFWVQAAMAGLPEDERRMVELAYFRGLSHGQIAASTGVPLGTVKTRIRRALGRMADAGGVA